MEMTTIEAIDFLSKLENKNKIFKRVNDNNFIIFKGVYGDCMMQVSENIRVFPLFNYIQDRWILIEEVSE
jgi:hypothetical protein